MRVTTTNQAPGTAKRARRHHHLDRQHPPPEADLCSSLEIEARGLSANNSQVSAIHVTVQQRIPSDCQNDQGVERQVRTAVAVHLTEALTQNQAHPKTRTEAVSFFKKLLLAGALAYAKDGLLLAAKALKSIAEAID